MKLLIISDAWHPQVNGVVRTYEHFSEELRRRGHDVRVIGPADFKFKVALPNYPEIKLVIAATHWLKIIIDDFQPDTIHIATEGPLGWAARKLCLREGRGFSTAYHTEFPDYIARRVGKIAPFLRSFARKKAQAYVRAFHEPSSVIMVATQSLEDSLKAQGFCAPMARVTRGANLDLFYPPTEGEERAVFRDLKAPIALYVGRVAIEKSIEDFLKMDWAGDKVIVGDGPARAALKRQYPKARFLGTKTRKELAAHYRSADVFVFPSRTDTFGMVLVEALACGLPVAAYNVTGPKDIITDDFLGVLNENDLALAAREALHCGLSEKRSAHVRAHYTWDHAAKQFERALMSTHTNKTRAQRAA